MQLHGPRDGGAAPLELAFMLPDHESLPPFLRQAFDGKGVFLTIEVDDVDPFFERIRRDGHEIRVELRDEAWGQRHFSVRDPSGGLLDVVKPIPPSVSSRSSPRRRQFLTPLCHRSRDEFVETWNLELPSAVACFKDDFEACIAHLRLPIAHRPVTRTTHPCSMGYRTTTTERVPVFHAVRAPPRSNSRPIKANPYAFLVVSFSLVLYYPSEH